MPDNVLDYAPAEEFDTGLFVARYLLALAVLSVAWMIALPVFFDTFELDLSPILLLMFASALKRHSPAARTLLLVIGGFGLLICVWMVVHALVFGTAHMTVHFGRPIHHPALWQVFLAAGSVALVIGVPFAVLLSPRARRQFREAAAEAK
jgi:DMSO/TMAO reductase YedYZ heme-binding membrane subunit